MILNALVWRRTDLKHECVLVWLYFAEAERDREREREVMMYQTIAKRRPSKRSLFSVRLMLHHFRAMGGQVDCRRLSSTYWSQLAKVYTSIMKCWCVEYGSIIKFLMYERYICVSLNSAALILHLGQGISYTNRPTKRHVVLYIRYGNYGIDQSSCPLCDP